MGAETSKEESRSNIREERQKRSQYVTQQARVTRQEPAAQTYQSVYQSPTPTPAERSRTPYTPENVQTVIKQPNQPNVLERTRNPYNYNSEELHGIKQSPNLYPNLNVNQEDGFVHVNNVQPRFSPQPSAPPASEINGAHGPFSPRVNAPQVPPTSRPLPSSSQVNVSSTPRQPCSQANVATKAQPACQGNVIPQVPPRPQQPSVSRGRDDISCPTCNQRYGLTIFQCANGHASCKDCRSAERSCGKCLSPITDMRNIAMEAVIADLSTNCQNHGCTLRFKYDEMQLHLKECPFGVMDCPMGTVFGQCSARCKVADMAAHFDEYHKEQRTGEIGKEMFVFNICMETHKMFLIKNGPHNFLVHVKIDERNRKISMTVQLLGTKFSAERWTYEIHVYNKRQPLRKYLFVDSCQAISTPVEDIFKENQCAVLPLSYAMTFVNESTFTYKFFIKKEMNQRERRGRTRNNANNRT